MSSFLPTEFVTERLRMRRFRAGDESWIYEYASDPEVTRYMDWPAHRDLADSVAYIEAMDAGWSTGGEYAWAVTLADGSPLGAIGGSGIDYKVSFGYVFARAAWGNGYATEVATALVGLLARIPVVQRIWATCDVDNAASARVLQKAGLECEGVLRKWKIRPNLPGMPARDSLMFSKLP